MLKYETEQIAQNVTKISVVVPTYNQVDYLRSCLDSIWFQEHLNLEIIVVNDGASDDTRKVLESFLCDVEYEETSFLSGYNVASQAFARTRHKRYNRSGRTLKIITHEENKGLAPSLNTGFRECTGVYCTYVPGDNICYPHMMTELSSALEESESDFVYSDMLIFDDAGNIMRSFRLPDYSFKACFQDWYLCGVSKLYKRELHEKCGFYDEDLLAHDHELFMRMAIAGARFHHVAKSLMAVRLHEGEEREIDIHAPKSWNRLLEESRRLVLQARSAV